MLSLILSSSFPFFSFSPSLFSRFFCQKCVCVCCWWWCGWVWVYLFWCVCVCERAPLCNEWMDAFLSP